VTGYGRPVSSVKQVPPAVGEGTVVIQQVHQYLEGRPARAALT